MKSPLKINFLGTGTSQGIPVIGCQCEVCRSTDHHDQRFRTAALLSTQNKNIVIDVGPDFRQQMLRTQTANIEAILLTHQHNDHIIGLDDVRPFNFMHNKNIPIYGTKAVLDDLRKKFAYIFSSNPYPGAPRIELIEINGQQPFHVSGIKIIPVEVMHGTLPVLGFRVDNFCYITDAKTISQPERDKLRGLDVLALNALHHHEHHSHLNISEALALIKDINPKEAYLTHISHNMGLHKKTELQLPSNVHVAYDGLELEL